MQLRMLVMVVFQGMNFNDCEAITEEIEVAENNSEDLTFEAKVDEELESDKVIEEVLVCSVTKPMEKERVFEREIIPKFFEIGVNVEYMKTFSDYCGNFDKSRVKVSPGNLKTIWGRRLELNNCSVIEYFPPPPGWKPNS